MKLVCKRKVTMIPSIINRQGKKREKKEILNVAAYCRVSTSQEK